MSESVAMTALRGLRRGYFPWLGMLLAAAAAAQDVLSIPTGDDGRLAPPPGVRLERIGVMETFAGTGITGDRGDGGLASRARFSFPRNVAVDAAGNVYVVDTQSHRIRRIDSAGLISTVAGTGADGDRGDGGPASEAELCYPAGAGADAEGNLYIADTWNHRVRKVDTEGVISTVAGIGRTGDGGDGGPASDAALSYPTDVAVDAEGNLYIADSWNHRLRRVSADGVISTIAGTGSQGDGGDGEPASDAALAYPVAAAADALGNLYVITFSPETRNRRIRRVDAQGVISAFAGTGRAGYGGDGGPAGAAQLANPLGLAVDGTGNVYIADTLNARIRVAKPGFQVTVPLGSSGDRVALVVSDEGVLTLGGSPVVDGREVSAGNGNVYALTADPDRTVAAAYLPESQSVQLPRGGVTLTRDEDGIWRIDGDAIDHGHRHLHLGEQYVLEFVDGRWGMAEYTIQTVAGRTEVAAEGVPATAALLRNPSDVAVDSVGSLYVAEWRGHRVRKIDPSGIVATLAGTGDWGYSGDGGPATEAMLNHPFAIATDHAGNVYVAERDGDRVRRIDPSGVITTFAGTGESRTRGDGGPATEAPLDRPLGVAVDPAGNVFVATSNRIRTIDSSGIITTFAGTGRRGSAGDGGLAVYADLADPHGIALDLAGNVYVADWNGHRIRRVDGSGIITAFAGTGDRGSDGDGGPAIEARLDHPLGVATDPAGNVYVAEDRGQRLRKIDVFGVITTYAGSGDQDEGGGPAVEARVGPFGIAADTTGNVYLAEPWENQVRRIDAAGIISTIAGGGERIAGPAQFDGPQGIVVSMAGDLFFRDAGTVWKLNPAGDVTRLAGSGVSGHSYLRGEHLAADTAGNLYVAERRRNLVRKIDMLGNLSTFAGTGEPESSGDGGLATMARLHEPIDVAIDSAGNLYVAEYRGHRVRRIDTGGTISTFAGTGYRGSSGDGGSATEAGLDSPVAVAVDPSGNVFIADRDGRVIRKVSNSGLIDTFADSNHRTSQGSLATDTLGRVYVGGSRRIQRIDADGNVSVIAGIGEDGYSGDGGPALSARFSVFGITVDRFGDVWFADRYSRRIRVLRRQDRRP